MFRLRSTLLLFPWEFLLLLLSLYPSYCQAEEESNRPFEQLSLNAINARLLGFKEDYPDFVRLTTAQEEYGLPRAGSRSDCPFDNGDEDGCLNYILRIQDYVSHPVGSDTSNRLPSVVWSGCLHGDERVGPTTVVETASLLLEVASCESKPRFFREREEAVRCRAELEARGISAKQRLWMARLVSTRRIVIIPTANALGYYRNRRGEGSIDPNRDFPYDKRSSNRGECMESIAGRTINEVFRDDMFRIGLTFHAGIALIGYEWGNPSHTAYKSPDDTAQNQLAAAMSSYGGPVDGQNYHYGQMNDVVYSVRGGMEDWAYAASWDTSLTAPCNPQTFGGYPPEKTIYNESTLRIFNILVETSNRKSPSDFSMGSSQNVLDPNSAGHVSRNLRLSLLSVDLVEPYISVQRVNGLRLSNDVIPLQKGGPSCKAAHQLRLASQTDQLLVSWTVGGAIEVDETHLWYALESAIDTDVLDCVSQPSREYVESVFTKGRTLSGRGFLAAPRSSSDTDPPFVDMVRISNIPVGERIVVLVGARVDGSWLEQDGVVGPDVPPQSHMVQSRTNPAWYHESAGKIVAGRLDWFSRPLFVTKESDSTEAVVVELSDRMRVPEPAPTLSRRGRHSETPKLKHVLPDP